MKGLAYLAMLLAEPGREIPASFLVADGQTSDPVRAIEPSNHRASTLADAGALLDRQARPAYAARLHELAAELRKARSFNDPGRVAELLEEALAVDILEREERGARRRFAHALIRETLYAALGAADRVRLHRKIAQALDALHAGDPELHLSELAHHFLEASPGGDVDRAVDLATRAAKRAAAQLAYEEAAAFYRRALRALEAKDEIDEAGRGELVLALGAAEWHAGEFTQSKSTILRAAEIAERSGQPEMLGRAAAAYSGEFVYQTVIMGPVDDVTVSLLEKALAALGPKDSPLRAILLGRLCSALAFPDFERSRALFDEAQSMAERVGDPRVLARVLLSGFAATSGPDALERRKANTETILRLADELQDDLLRAAGETSRAFLAGEVGHAENASAAFAAAERFAARARQPYIQWLTAVSSAGWALRSAPTAEAESRIRRAFEIGSRGGQNLAAALVFGFQRGVLLERQGRVEEGEATLREIRTAVQSPAARAGLAISSVGAGKLAEARRLFSEVAQNNFRDIPRDMFYLTTMALLVDVAERLGDLRRASILYDLLLPYRDRVAASYLSYVGAVSRYLGVAATMLSRLDDAARHFETALDLESDLPVCLALTQYAYARLLKLRAAPGDRQRALSLLAAALENARSFEMRKVVAEAMALKLELEGVASADVRSSIDVVLDSIEATKPDLRSQYRRRLEDLREEAEEANRFNDPGRAARAEEEIEALTRELSAAVGLGGRDRRAGSAAERARLSVTVAIKTAIRKIAENGPSLGRHLSTSVRTGRFCSYSPGPGSPISWTG